MKNGVNSNPHYHWWNSLTCWFETYNIEADGVSCPVCSCSAMLLWNPVASFLLLEPCKKWYVYPAIFQLHPGWLVLHRLVGWSLGLLLSPIFYHAFNHGNGTPISWNIMTILSQITKMATSVGIPNYHKIPNIS